MRVQHAEFFVVDLSEGPYTKLRAPGYLSSRERGRVDTANIRFFTDVRTGSGTKCGIA